MRRLTLAVALAVCNASSAATPGPSPPGALQACAEIPDERARLACYDGLAGRPQGPGAAPTAPAPPIGAAATPGAGQAAAAPPPMPAAPAAPAAAAPARDSFGLYAAEHPAPPPAAPSLVARIEAFGRSAAGRPTLTLEGGQVWELDAQDALLAVGDTVRIRRATLGSFLLETPSKRTHRARRLR